MNSLSPDEYWAALKYDFPTFFSRCFQELHPGAELQLNWHIELMAQELQLCLNGKCRRLIINVPPRYLKSQMVSVAFTAFWLGHFPAARLLCLSYAQDLSDKHSRDVRIIMNTAWYRQIFSTRLSSPRQALQELITTAQGYRLASSIGGVVTGRGADLIIIDDPLKAEEAYSETQRKNVNEYFDHTVVSRLDNKETGIFVIVAHRLHEDDLVGHVLQQEPWKVLSLPAIAEEDESYLIESVFGTRRVERKAGEVLHPERESRAILDRLRRTLGEYNFAGQYQQAPAPLGGGLVKPAWFSRYEPHELPEKPDMVLGSWDTASKAGELNDHSVCTTFIYKKPNIYLKNVFRKRLNFPDLKRAVSEQASLFGHTVILIEDKNSGTQLIQELLAAGLHAVKKYTPVTDKISRLVAQTTAIENGFVFLPREAGWLAEYLHEMASFPKGRYDDQVDSTAQALEWIKTSLSNGAEAWLEHFKRLSEEATGVKEPAQRLLKAPAGWTQVFQVLKYRLSLLPDRTCWIPEDAVDMLLRNGWTKIA